MTHLKIKKFEHVGYTYHETKSTQCLDLSINVNEF